MRVWNDYQSKEIKVSLGGQTNCLSIQEAQNLLDGLKDAIYRFQEDGQWYKNKYAKIMIKLQNRGWYYSANGIYWFLYG